MKNKRHILSFRYFCISLTGIIIATFLSSSSCVALTGVDAEEALKQTAYAYYMRGFNIQYSSRKANSNNSYFAPEEATEQDMHYAVCSAYAEYTYYDLLGGVKLPADTDKLTKYAQDFYATVDAGSGDGQAGWGVLMYGERQSDNKKKTAVYNPKTGERLASFDNMEIDDLIPYLKPGDILTYRANGSGHTMMIYDLFEDGSGNANARTIESNGSSSVKSKISKSTTIGTGANIVKFGWGNHGLYFGKKQNTTFPDGREEGSIRLSTIRDVSTWKNFDASNSYNYYSVLRLLSNDGSDTILSYQGARYGSYDYTNKVINDAIPQKTRDRIKYPKLFIKKTVDVFEGSVVEEGDSLTYKITIKNESDASYTDSLSVAETISPFVDYESYESSKPITFSKPSVDTVAWNIGALSSGEEVVIEYKVKVKEGTIGKTIISEGTVASIGTSKVENLIQRNIPDNISSEIAPTFDSLKSTYNGKELINEIYKKVTGDKVDLDLTNFKIRDLIKNNPINSQSSTSISLDTNNPLYGAVLNKYWSTMLRQAYDYKGETVYAFDQKLWQGYHDPSRRRDVVYEDNLETGDILIYINEDDFAYGYDSTNDAVIKTPITYENGEYAYIFIEGRGFVGVNIGNDEDAGTRDDRNEFNIGYYTDNGLTLYSASTTDRELLKAANYQTLFGKDYYVILRPSLMFDLSGVATSNPKTFDNFNIYLLAIPIAGTLSIIGIIKKFLRR